MAAVPRDPALTRYLRDPHAAGDALIADAVPVVYRELRAIAAAHLRRARRPADLAPTSLVHEAYVKLLGQDGADVRDRQHFYALAARAMRQLAIDHARARLAKKRGGDRGAVTLDEAIVGAAGLDSDILDVDTALRELEAVDARAARVVELRYFADLSMDEIAQALGVSLSTVEREWRSARAWMGRRLRGGRPPGPERAS